MKVSTQWNNKNDYHATITDAQNLFGRTQFTLLADVMIEEPSSDKTKTAMRSAFTISTGSNRLHLLTYDGKVGYGVASARTKSRWAILPSASGTPSPSSTRRPTAATAH